MSLLLALVGASVVEPPAPPPAQTYLGGWSAPEPQRRKKREQWREELDALFAKPAPVEIEQAVEKPRTVYVPDIGRAGQKYIDALLASIATAQQEQQRAQQQAALATAERKAEEAQARLAQAIEAEQTARRQIRQFDIAFVAAVLADL